MNIAVLSLLLFALPQQQTAPREVSPEVEKLVEQIAQSGRVLAIATGAEERLETTRQIAPGDPPLLAFRYFEGEAKHRFGKLDLVMDDAGH